LGQPHPGSEFSTVKVEVVDERELRLVAVVKPVSMALAIAETMKRTRKPSV
jgi:hypothetical protein